MKPWERRLKDLSIILSACEKNYFEPELFRINLNNFLQISRTITFVIQKNKATILGFDEWYPEIQKKWSEDNILRWAKDSRNKIEKEGDLELNSSLRAALIYSYDEKEDLNIEIPKSDYLFKAIGKLLDYLSRYGAELENEEWVIRVERQWIANTLPGKELLYAMTYIYAKIYSLCDKIAQDDSSQLDYSIPKPASFHITINDSKKSLYFDGDNKYPGELIYKTIKKDETFKITPLLEKHKSEWSEGNSLKSYFDILKIHAIELFNTNGAFYPTLYSFDSQNKLIDFKPLLFDKRYKKFIIWRDIAEQLSYLDWEYLIFISEAWIKKMPKGKILSITRLPNINEVLNIDGIDKHGHYINESFEILRQNKEASIGRAVDDNMIEVPGYLKIVLDKKRG